MIDHPDGIVITFPVVYFYERSFQKYPPSERMTKKERIMAGYRATHREMISISKDPDNRWWINSMNNKPTHPFEYIYITALGSIHWRGNFIGWEDGGKREFENGFSRDAKHWLLIGNIIQAPGIFPFKGTQGFRYTTKLF